MKGRSPLTRCLAWGLATAIGLTALLTGSRLAYDTLRIGSAAYLTWLGVSTPRRGRRQRRREAEAAVPTKEPGGAARAGGSPRSAPASRPICSTPRPGSSP